MSSDDLLPQTLQIDDLVVRGASVPALPDDPDPFEGQGADAVNTESN